MSNIDDVTKWIDSDEIEEMADIVAMVFNEDPLEENNMDSGEPLPSKCYYTTPWRTEGVRRIARVHYSTGRNVTGWYHHLFTQVATKRMQRKTQKSIIDFFFFLILVNKLIFLFTFFFLSDRLIFISFAEYLT